MEFDEVVRKRHSVRSYTAQIPPDSDIAKILKAADMAPSAGGLKSRRVFVVKDQWTRRQLANAAHHQDFVAEAPIVLVFCADLDMIASYGRRGRELYCIQDTSAAIENALLKATDLGLGSCWVGAFQEEAVSKICRLPQWLRPVALVTIGYER
ncbi:MAG: nitroreductase family protein [Candidatus Aminicenantes bacterium]|nr:MAG: nitroreductase family protein [Candidatus Aminicenantes bacterium]